MTHRELFGKFLDFVDVPTKLNLQQLKDEESLAEYRYTRTILDDSCDALDIIIKKQVRIDFIHKTKQCDQYNKAIRMIWDYEEDKFTPYLLTENEYIEIKEAVNYLS